MWASGAMETILFSLLIVSAVLSYFYARVVCASFKIAAISGVLFGLISMTRPEGFALIGTIFAFELVFLLHKHKTQWRIFATIFSIYLIVTGIMFLGRHEIYGEWFPVTVGAKTGNLAWQIQLGQSYIFSFLKAYWILTLAFIFSVGYLFFKRKENENVYLLMWISLIVVSGYLLFNLLVGGDWMLGWRFITPVLVFFALVIGLSFSIFNNKFGYLFLIIILLANIFSSKELHSASLNQAMSDRGDILMGQYIYSLKLPKDTKIAVIDAGAIPYYAKLSTIDMIGLNDNHISKLEGGFLQKYDNDYVLSPEFIQ
jgi:hypothetical protein